MLILGTTHICLVAPKNIQGHKNLFEGLCGKSMITNRTGLKKLQGASSWNYLISYRKKQRPQRMVLTVAAAEQTCKCEETVSRPVTSAPVCSELESVVERRLILPCAVLEH